MKGAVGPPAEAVPAAARGAHPAPADLILRSARWKPAEYVFWVIALGVALVLPRQLLLLNEIAILALFALSLDLILGYAGIVSLGHAAFLGLGAYTAGILAQQGWNDPLLGLGAAAVLAAALGFATSFLLLRGTDLTRLMVTLGIALMLGELANRFSGLTGGADGLQGVTVGPVLGVFAFDLFGRTAYLYSLTVLFVLFLLARRIVHSPFGLSLRAVKANPLRARAIGISTNVRLVAIYTIAAAYAGIAGALLAQTTQYVSLDVLEFHRSADVLLVLVIGGVGYLYGGILGAVIFKVMQDVLMSFTPQYWLFWIGLVLVVLVLTGRERVSEAVQRAAGRLFALIPGFARRA